MGGEKKKMLVIGFGKSGKAAARFGLKQKMAVCVTDLRSEKELKEEMRPFEKSPIDWHLGGHPDSIFQNVDLIVASPGVPPALPGIQKARKAGVPVISEMDLALQQIQVPTIAVTGTNGKTTTVHLIHHLLQTAGKKSVLAGNVGTPLLDCFDDLQSAEALVLEVSSYQLETTPHLKSKVAVWLNVTDDHLDWHECFEAYVEAKTKLFRSAGTQGTLIYNEDDAVVSQVVHQFPVARLGFSTRRKLLLGAWVEEGRLCFRMSPREEFSLSLNQVLLKGIQNWENMMAAVLAVRSFGISKETLQEGLNTFRGLPHRMELVRIWNGIHFVNDSKATNVGAVVKALEGLSGPVIW